MLFRITEKISTRKYLLIFAFNSFILILGNIQYIHNVNAFDMQAFGREL